MKKKVLKMKVIMYYKYDKRQLSSKEIENDIIDSISETASKDKNILRFTKISIRRK